MPLPRSFLYVPANREKFLDKALGLPADAFIFDLEDSVPPAEKVRARQGVRDYAPKIPDLRVWVRPNALTTEFGRVDLDAVIGVEGVAGLFVPKVDNRDDVLRWDELIGGLEARRGLDLGAVKLVLSIERAACSTLTTWRLPRHAWCRSPSAAPRTATSTRISAAPGRSTGRKCCMRAATRCSPRAPPASTRRSTACSPTCAIRRGSSATPRCRAASAIAAASSSMRRRLSRATGSIARARPSSTTTGACWRHSIRRSVRAAPARSWTAA